MKVFGYIFLAEDKNHLVPAAEQQAVLEAYARNLNRPFFEIFVEEATPMKRPFKDRSAGSRVLKSCGPGDAILVMRTEWVMSSAGEGESLLRFLAGKDIALHCIDLGGNISLPEKRRLMVSEGPATVVGKLLAALAVSETSRHGQAIRRAKKNRKAQGKYLGGPVPFGWEVSADGHLVPYEPQQEVIRSIVDMRRNRWSYREISQKLRDEQKVRLSHEGVRRLLSSIGGKAGRGGKGDSG
ncbi:MAG: recombinase family protein [Desulforhopalus sp.]|nr:recombinase family protein [Desulforhopalus sp.]